MFCHNKGSNAVRPSKCIHCSNSKGEKYWASHRGPAELGTVYFQDKNHSLKLSITILLWPGLLMPLTLSNLWSDGHVLIAYKIVWLLGALSMPQRGTMKSNYVQAKLLNGQWKWEFQLFFNNLFTDALVLSVFRAYDVPHWWLQARNQQKIDGEDRGCPDTWAICSYPGVWLQPLSFYGVFKHRCRAFCLFERGKYPIWLKKKNTVLIGGRVLGLTWPWALLKRHRK